MFGCYRHDDPDHADPDTYGIMLQTAIRFGCNVAAVHATDEGWAKVPTNPRQSARIAVWWADDRSGELMTLLAWMCTRQSAWHSAEIDVWVVSTADAQCDRHEWDRIAARLDDARLPAKVVGISPAPKFAESVKYADLVIAPLRVLKGVPLGPNKVPIDDLICDLPLAMFLHAAAPVELDLQPDDAVSAILATAQDRATELTTRADELSQHAGTLMVKAEMLRMDLDNTDAGAQRVFAEATNEATAAHRKYLAARSRSDAAWTEVEEIDPTQANGALDPELWVPEAAASRPKRSSRT